jgi:hypothetical protein
MTAMSFCVIALGVPVPDKPHPSDKPVRTDRPMTEEPQSARAAGSVVAANQRAPATTPLDTEVANFIARMKTAAPVTTGRRGRLMFAMDATMSREPTWDLALGLQAEMFAAVKAIGSLDVQLVYFRGFGECRASKWVSDPDALARLMTVQCRGGQTQIAKVLGHARSEAEKGTVSAIVYVGDAMEEAIDAICTKAGEVALLGVPIFLFQEGGHAQTTIAFKEIARITNGAHCRFDQGSARQLRELLMAVAVYAAGGRKALETLSHQQDGAGARLLLGQMK